MAPFEPFSAIWLPWRGKYSVGPDWPANGVQILGILGGEVVGELLRWRRSPRTAPPGRSAVSAARAVVVLGDLGVVPVGDLVGEDLGQRLARQAQVLHLVAVDLDLVREGGAPGRDRQVGVGPALRGVGGAVPRVEALVAVGGHGEVGDLVGEVLPALGVAVGVVDDLHALALTSATHWLTAFAAQLDPDPWIRAGLTAPAGAADDERGADQHRQRRSYSRRRRTIRAGPDAAPERAGPSPPAPLLVPDEHPDHHEEHRTKVSSTPRRRSRDRGRAARGWCTLV